MSLIATISVLKVAMRASPSRTEMEVLERQHSPQIRHCHAGAGRPSAQAHARTVPEPLWSRRARKWIKEGKNPVVTRD
jgi:hypothetical protein